MKPPKNTYSYEGFISTIKNLVLEGKSTGEKQTEARSSFTVLNLKRMERIYKTVSLNRDLQYVIQALNSAQDWYLITESWCGDSAQILPVIARISDLSFGRINLHIILRDENPEWIERYNTFGSHSIPKLVAFNKNGEELFSWGPRPNAAQMLLLEWKTNPNGKEWEDFERDLHTWYAKDKTVSLQSELYDAIQKNIFIEVGTHYLSLPS